MRKIFCAVVLWLMAAGPSPAAVQAVKVSGSLDNYFLYRRNFNLGSDTPDIDNVQKVFFSMTTVGVAAELGENVSTTVELINERIWDTDPAHAGSTADDNSKVNLNAAYVTLKEMVSSPLTVVIGHQPLNYGNAFIVGAGGQTQANSTALTNVANDLTCNVGGYDAVRAILDYKPLTVDGFYSRLDDTTSGTTSDVDTDVDLVGLNVSYELGDKRNSLVEGYFFSKTDKSNANAGEGEKTDTIYVLGGRLVTNPMASLNLQLEAAHQNGNKRQGAVNNQTRDAWGVQFFANYRLPVLEKYQPLVGYKFTKVTGDANSGTDKTYTAWDPVYEDQDCGKIYNSLVTLSNLVVNEIALTVNPMEDVTAKLGYSHLMLERKLNGASFTLLQPGAASLSPDVLPSSRNLGKELDVDLTYHYTEDVQIGMNVGYFMPGNFFAITDRVSAKQVMANIQVVF